MARDALGFVGLGVALVKEQGGCSCKEKRMLGRAGMMSVRRASYMVRPTSWSSSAAAPGPGGRIELIMGPMFAGKTTELLRRCQERRSMGQKILLVKSDKDTRYSKTEVVSHDQKKEPCFSVNELRPFLEDEGFARQFDVAAIDEAQFFPDLLEFCKKWSDSLERTVIVAGLDADCERQRFGQLVDLVPHAESVCKLKASCGICGQAASFTKRTVSTGGQVVVGGSELYMAVCREHYNMTTDFSGCSVEIGNENSMFSEESHGLEMCTKI